MSQASVPRNAYEIAELGEIGRVEWEAAMLFAADDRAALKQFLEAQARDERPEAWRLLFGLDRLNGDEESFESRALDYAVKFEISPPLWVAAGADAAEGPAGEWFAVESMIPDDLMAVLLRLDKPEPVALDFGAVKRIEVAGCELLAQGMRERLQKRRATSLRNVERIVAGIRQNRLASANANADAKAAWLFVLVAQQLLGKRDEFERDAAQYRKTFGEFVEWHAGESVAGHAVGTAAPDHSAIRVGRDLATCDALWFAALERGAKKATLDFSATRGASLAAAHAFVAGIARLHRAGIALTGTCVNELMQVLFDALGSGRYMRTYAPGESPA